MSDAQRLAELVLADHERSGDSLSRATIELARTILKRNQPAQRTRVVWDVNDPPKWDD